MGQKQVLRFAKHDNIYWEVLIHVLEGLTWGWKTLIPFGNDKKRGVPQCQTVSGNDKRRPLITNRQVIKNKEAPGARKLDFGGASF